jgi:hypothetical protein
LGDCCAICFGGLVYLSNLDHSYDLKDKRFKQLLCKGRSNAILQHEVDIFVLDMWVCIWTTQLNAYMTGLRYSDAAKEKAFIGRVIGNLP